MVNWKTLIKKVVSLSGYGVVNLRVANDPQKQKPATREHFFDLYFSQVNPHDFFFVQIGANDGQSSDPLYPYVNKYKLSGLVVEPLPDAFERLQETYRQNPGIIFANAAVGAVSGLTTFYVVKEAAKTRENWFAMTRISSFNKAVIEKSLIKKIPPGANAADYLQEIPIQTLSFADLVKKYNVKKIDFLQIDSEGHDYEILKTIDFSHFSPTILNFESDHLSLTQRKECEAFLANRGYKFFNYGGDTCAYKYQ